MNEYTNPSTYTTLYWLIQEKKITPDVFFNFLSFFWPSFIKVNDHIFIKEKYSEEEYKQLIDEKDEPEYWINLVTINDYFSEELNWEEKAKALAKALVEIWETKLKKNFPNIEFTVKYIHDKELGEYGLTFYQTNRINQL